MLASRSEALYTDAIKAGADTVLSVHLSPALSGTWDSARLGAAIGAHAGPGMLGVVVLPEGINERVAAT